MTRKLLSLILVLLMKVAFAVQASAPSDFVFPDETLHYVVTYKWGLVQKDAGDATMSLRDKGDRYELILTGKSKPWADRIFEVRDTLFSSVRKDGFRPLRYIKTAHEGGKYSKDDIKYSYSGTAVTGECLKYREKKGKVGSQTSTLTAEREAFDMLSIFYYLRTIDYAAFAPGKTITTCIFSGVNKERVTIKSLGIEDVKMKDGSKRRAYHIRFNFTSGNGKKSSDDIDAWLSADNRRIPLVVIGKLPIGSVRVYLV